MITDIKIEEVKNAVRIESVIGGQVDLKISGKQFLGLCPFHKDHTPSFTVYPDTQSWYCFGCGKGGDVFKFLQDSNGGDFSKALKEVARIGGVPLQGNEDLSGYVEHQKVEEIRLFAVDHYHQILLGEEGQAALNYLITERGFSVDLIKDSRLGYAPVGKNSLNHYLTEKGFSAELGIKAGVLTPDKTDYFKGYLIFPNILNGRVVTFQGRAFPDHEPKYKQEPGKIDHLIGESALHRHKEVLIVEGWPDFLTLRQAGYENVVGIYGVSGFREEWVRKFNGVKTVYLALDGDNAGKEGSLKVASFFENSKAMIVPFPESEFESESKSSIKDWNDLYTKNCQKDITSFKEVVDKSLAKAKTKIDLKIEYVKNFHGDKRIAEIKDLLADLVHLSPLELGLYLGKISTEFEISRRDLNGELRLVQQELAQQEHQVNEPQKVELSFEEKESAEKLLKNPGLLEMFLKVTEEEGCVGEKHILKLIYLVLTSRLLSKPIALVVKGESSSGKSYLVTMVSQYFPESEVKTVTKMTANALYYLAEKLKHKALIVQENPGTKDADYPVRSMQSEGFVTVWCPMKNEKTGRMETVEIKVEGPIAYIETTTRARLHNENETRLFSIYLNDSQGQTVAIIKKQAEVAQSGSLQKSERREAVRKNFINAQTLLGKYEIRIPYATLIPEKFPSDKTRARRDHTRVHALINASALLHQYQREKGRDGDVEYLVANIEDYRVAYDLAPHVLREAVQGRSQKSDELLQICRDFVEDKEVVPLDTVEFTRADLIQKTGWSAPTITKCLKELEYNGYIDQARTGGHNAYVYKLTTRGMDPESKSLNFLPTPEEIESAMVAIKL